MSTHTHQTSVYRFLRIFSLKGWRILLALVLFAMLAAAPSQLALADAGGVKGHTFHVSFTKWITSLPANPPSVAGVSMAGVVGGDVGEGHFIGKVLDDNLTVPGFWLGHARYGIYGDEHNFVADMHVTENDMTNPATATLTGVILRGWLKGSRVTGEYTVMSVCPIATPGNVFGTLCFQGNLQVIAGSGR